MAAGRRVRHKQKSSGGLVVGLAAAVLLVGGGFGWAMTTGEGDSTTATKQNNSTVSAPEVSSMTPFKACLTEVQAADKVVDAARQGIGHWSAHVQARTDLFSGENSSEVTSAIWKRTRLAGPADQKAYDAASAEYEAVDNRGTCDDLATESADAADCADRMDALKPAMATGRQGMADWQSHLEAMADHAAGKFGVNHAQQLWEEAYRQAPPNINAFERADEALGKAPACG